MAYTTINKSTDYFNTKLYTGNGSTNNITGVGFQPDWTWIKQRNGTANHFAFDAVRGVNKPIHPNLTNAQSTQSDTLMSFNSDGFTLGDDSTNGEINSSSNTFASWNWVGGTAISGNTGGSGTSRSFTGRINTTSKFGIYTYQGNGTGGHTIPHGLGAVPTMIITKRINDAELWPVYHQAITASKFLKLNTDASEQNATNRWNANTPTSTVFTLGSEGEVNGSSDYYITYVFCDVPGYAKMGSYAGNGNADGAFIYTGFKPAVIIIKRTNDTGNWNIIDNKRLGRNPNNPRLTPNANAAEDSADATTDILSNGFKLKSTSQYVNYSGGSYVYMAFAEAPLVGSNNVPCTAR